MKAVSKSQLFLILLTLLKCLKNHGDHESFAVLENPFETWLQILYIKSKNGIDFFHWFGMGPFFILVYKVMKKVMSL